MKTIHCIECKFHSFPMNRYLHCDKKNKYIKFYKPKNELDETYGWKAKCDIYEMIEKIEPNISQFEQELDELLIKHKIDKTQLRLICQK